MNDAQRKAFDKELIELAKKHNLEAVLCFEFTSGGCAQSFYVWEGPNTEAICDFVDTVNRSTGLSTIGARELLKNLRGHRNLN